MSRRTRGKEELFLRQTLKRGPVWEISRVSTLAVFRTTIAATRLLLNMRYLNYAIGLRMTNAQWNRGGQPHEAESQVTQRDMDIAFSIQSVNEEIILSQLIHSGRERYDLVIIDTPAAGNSADAYIIAARGKAGLVARLDALVERIGVARAPMLGIAHNES